MASTYNIGDAVTVAVKYTTSTGSTAGADPTNVEFHYLNPAGTVVSTTSTSSTGLIRSTTGEFYYDVLATASGHYYYRHTSTGTLQTSIEGMFLVRPRKVK